MTNRPTALSGDVVISSIETADQVLHEIAWIRNRLTTLAAGVKSKIDALKAEVDQQAVVSIDGADVRLQDRLQLLEDLLLAWTGDEIAGHLPDGKRSIDLPHGKLGLRQQPLVAELDDCSPGAVLECVKKLVDFQEAINKLLNRKIGLGSARLSDLITISVAPALKPAKDAFEASLLTRDELATLGIRLRDPYDEPVVTPTKIIT